MPNLLEKDAGYLTTLQTLNLYTPSNIYDLNSSASIDAISAIVNGIEGVSAGFSNALASLVLLPNTPIQQIATIELAKNIAAQASQNLRNTVIPTLNVKGNDISFNSPNYWNISSTVPDTSISGILNAILNYTPEVNPIPFITNNFTPQNSDDFLKANRGQGQIDSYNLNISQNEFSPDDVTKQYGGESITQDDIILGTYNNSLLNLTNKIISDNSLKNGYPGLVEQEGDSISLDAYVYKNKDVTNTNLPGFGAQSLLPRGDGTFTDDTQTVFLRTFNYQKQYQGTKDLMKFNNGYAGTNSVLQTVFPNISPLKTDTDVRNLMFSIENLAYAGNGTANLKSYETGMNGGRAMWFPPYGLEINESINANWNNVDFIGRSEPIYTYNSRERMLNLSFILIVDYPSDLNDSVWKTNSDNEYNKFFRQDNAPNLKYTVGQIDQIKAKRLEETILPKTPPSNTYTTDFSLSQPLIVHYDNNKYNTTQELTQDVNGVGQKDNDDFYNRLSLMIDFLNTDDGKKFTVNIGGFASKLSNSKYNSVLSWFRAKDVYNTILNSLTDKSYALSSYNYNLSQLVLPTTNQYTNQKFQISIYGDTRAINANSTKNTFNQDVIDRKVIVWLSYNPALDTTINPTPEDADSLQNRINQFQRQNVQVSTSNTKGGEYKYFERLKNDEDNQLVLQTYSEKIDYFHPVFHSQTPEDFNTRLTFLQQCTLQGTAASGIPNSVFGKPPVCVLRLGDFFHTKIIITSININYEPLLWDMNPEGIGMQPKLCNITLDCKVIGGQDLSAPLTQLQNALSYNFYANTSVYHQDALLAATQQTTNTTISSTGQTLAPKKVISQTANINATVQNTANQPTGDIVGSSTKSGTISYSTQFDDIIGTLNQWSSILLIIGQDARFTPWLNTSTGTLQLNNYNLYFNGLSNSDKAAQAQTLGLITAYNSDLSNDMYQYTTIYNNLLQIQTTGMDGNKILNTSDSSFTFFTTMLSMLNDFLNQVIYNINSQTSSSVSAKLSILQKYAEQTVQNIPFTT